MKKAFVKKFLDDPKYFRAYWIITTEQLSRIEANCRPAFFKSKTKEGRARIGKKA
jgi:hypothetical protein